MDYVDQRPGVKNFTTEGAVGTSRDAGHVFPVRFFAISILAGVGTDATITLYNGNDTSGTKYLRYTAKASSATVEDIHEGFLFPAGCFVGTSGAGIEAINVSHFVESV